MKKKQEPNSEYNISYKKTFDKKDHELIATVKYIDNWESSDQTFHAALFSTQMEHRIHPNLYLQQSLNDEFEKQWLFQLDYVKPIGKEGKFETGFRSSFRDMINDYVVTEKNASGRICSPARS